MEQYPQYKEPMLCEKLCRMLTFTPWQQTIGDTPWQAEEQQETINEEVEQETTNERGPILPPDFIPDPALMPSGPTSFLIKGNKTKVSKKAIYQSLNESEDEPTQEIKKSWPEHKRISTSNYSAVEIHGFFGLIDDGSSISGRMLRVHVPKWIRGYFLDIRQGENIHVYHVNGKVGGILNVLSVGRDKYYPPGSRVTTCSICVPEEQWARFAPEDQHDPMN